MAKKRKSKADKVIEETREAIPEAFEDCPDLGRVTSRDVQRLPGARIQDMAWLRKWVADMERKG